MRKIFILMMILVATSIFATDVKWAKDYKSAIQEGREKDKPVMFILSRHSCKYCVMLDETTLKDPYVVERLNKDFISVVSYTDDNDFVPTDLWRPGTPAIWFLLPSGEPMYQPIMGAIDSKVMLGALTTVKQEYEKLKQ